MTSKSVGGWDLFIGPYLADGYYREEEPYEQGNCSKCSSSLTQFKLYKHIFAFGLTIKKRCTISACSACLNEELLTTPQRKLHKKSSSSRSTLAKFKALTPSQQKLVLDEFLKAHK